MRQESAYARGVIPRTTLEGALQVERALVKFFTKSCQGERFVEVLLDEAAHRLYYFRGGVAACGFRPATQAGAVAGVFCFSGLWKNVRSRGGVAGPGTKVGNRRRWKTRQKRIFHPDWRHGLEPPASTGFECFLHDSDSPWAISFASTRLSIALVVMMLKA